MPNPFGGNQTSSLPNGGRINGAGPGSSNSVGSPDKPSDVLLVANNVNPTQVTVTGTAIQLDADKVQNRISISVQNQGSVTVEIYPNQSKPTFGAGGWQIASGGWFDFNWTEDVKVYAVTGGTSVVLAVFQNIKN